jgi:hypothetical protein
MSKNDPGCHTESLIYSNDLTEPLRVDYYSTLACKSDRGFTRLMMMPQLIVPYYCTALGSTMSRYKYIQRDGKKVLASKQQFT